MANEFRSPSAIASKPAQGIKIMRLTDIPRGAKLDYPDGSAVVDISANTLRQYFSVLAAEPVIADYLKHR